MNRNTPWGETPLLNMHCVVQSKHPPHQTIAAFRDFLEACEYLKAIHAYRTIHRAWKPNFPETLYRVMEYYHGSWSERRLDRILLEDVVDDEEAA